MPSLASVQKVLTRKRNAALMLLLSKYNGCRTVLLDVVTLGLALRLQRVRNKLQKTCKRIQAENRKRAGFGIQVDLTKPNTTSTEDSTASDKVADQLRAAQDLLFAEKNRAKLLGDMTAAERLQAQGKVRELEIERQYQELLSNSLCGRNVTLQMAEQEAYKNNQLEIERQLKELSENALNAIDDEKHQRSPERN